MLPRDFTQAVTGAFRGVDDIRPSVWADAEVAPVTVVGETHLEGALVVQRWEERRADSTFEVVNVFMADAASDEILLYSFDTAGFPADPPARGRWSGGCVDLLRKTPRGESCTTFVAAGNGFRWSKIYRRDPGHPWTTVVEGVLTREGSGAGPAR